MAGTKQPAVKQDRQQGGRVTPPTKTPTKPAPQVAPADRTTRGQEDS